jgi:hypothetical protein
MLCPSHMKTEHLLMPRSLNKITTGYGGVVDDGLKCIAYLNRILLTDDKRILRRKFIQQELVTNFNLDERKCQISAVCDVKALPVVCDVK